MSDKAVLDEIRQRVTRLESRVVVGFEALGVSFETDKPRWRENDYGAVVTAPSRNASFVGILSAIPKGYKGLVIVVHKEHEIGRFKL